MVGILDYSGLRKEADSGRFLVTRTQDESVKERNANDDAGLRLSIGAPFGFGHIDSLQVS
jgi:hypothetical protein